jgi:hypothetical protein
MVAPSVKRKRLQRAEADRVEAERLRNLAVHQAEVEAAAAKNIDKMPAPPKTKTVKVAPKKVEKVVKEEKKAPVTSKKAAPKKESAKE